MIVILPIQVDSLRSKRNAQGRLKRFLCSENFYVLIRAIVIPVMFIN